MKNLAVEPLVKEKNELIIKTDNPKNYKNEKELNIDLEKIGEIKKQIWEMNTKFLKEITEHKTNIYPEIPEKDMAVKDIRKLINKKHAVYKITAKLLIDDYYKKLVKLKRDGVKIKDDFKDGKITQKEMLKQALKY